MGGEQAAGLAEHAEVVRPAGEVAGVDFGGAEVLDFAEAGEFQCHLGWGEEELQRLAGLGYAGGERIVGELFEEGEGRAGLAVVEDEGAAWGLLGDEGDGGVEGFEGEVGDYAEPGEEGGLLWVEAGGDQFGGEGLAFEVDRDVGEVGRDWNVGGGEEVAFPGLGGGVVYFENAQLQMGIAVGEGVEACA